MRPRDIELRILRPTPARAAASLAPDVHTRGWDFSASAERALGWAANLHKAIGGEPLRLIHAINSRLPRMRPSAPSPVAAPKVLHEGDTVAQVKRAAFPEVVDGRTASLVRALQFHWSGEATMKKGPGAGESPYDPREASGRGRSTQRIGRILIAIDLTDSAEPVPFDALNSAHQVRHHGGPGAAPRLVAEAIPLAQALGASIEIVYVRETRSQGARARSPTVDVVDDWVDRCLEEMAESAAAAGVECLTTSLQGSARRTLVEHVKKTEPDLVILGSHARWHLLTTCSEQVLRDAHRRILVVPIDDPELIE